MKTYVLAVAALICLAGGVWLRGAGLESARSYANQCEATATTNDNLLKRQAAYAPEDVHRMEAESARLRAAGKQAIREAEDRGTPRMVAGSVLAVVLGAFAVRAGRKCAP